MDKSSLQPDYSPMAMLPYTADATNVNVLNSEDCLDPRELCNSSYAPTAHEDASWPFSNDAALDDVPTQPRILDLDLDIDFSLDSLDNDLNIPSTMQLASDTRNVPSYEECTSFGPSTIDPPEINVKKGEKKCPYCSKQFVGGAAAVRKHIERMHIKKGQIEGEVIRSTPGRAKAKKIHEDEIRLATKRRRVDDDDTRAYLPLAKRRESEATTHVTVKDFRNIRDEMIKLQQQYAELQVFAMRLQAGMNNQSHDIVGRFDKSFEKHLFVSLENMRMKSSVLMNSNPCRPWNKDCHLQLVSLEATIRTRYPREIGSCKLVYEDGNLKWSVQSTNITFKCESKHEKEKASCEDPFFRISIALKSRSSSCLLGTAPYIGPRDFYIPSLDYARGPNYIKMTALGYQIIHKMIINKERTE